MKKVQGFTLIELVVVIVILGILAVTAAPRFLNLQKDARESSLQGLKGVMAGAASIVYGKSAIEGKETDKTGSAEVSGINIYNGYPSATASGIGKAVDGLEQDWSVAADVTTLGSRTYLAAFHGVKGAEAIKATNCYVQYTEVIDAMPKIEVKNGGC